MPRSRFTKADQLFRERLKSQRKAKGMTQARLAARLGYPQSYVSKYGTGERRLDFVETLAVCDALGISVSDLAAMIMAKHTGPRRKTDE